MLKLRLLTALILIPFVLWIVLFGSPLAYAPFLILVAGIATWEWSRLVQLKSFYTRLSYIIFIMTGIGVWVYLNYLTLIHNLGPQPTDFLPLHHFYYVCLLIINAIGIIAATMAIMTYPKTVNYWHYRWIVIFCGFLFIVTATISLWRLQYYSPQRHYLVTLLLLTWATDTGAYFTGRSLGNRKFLPVVSPNKTWAGFWGGFLLAEVVVISAGFLFASKNMGWFYWMLTGTMSILGAVIGDLLISLLKRCINIKDTGKILPGHGGVLDRIDSLLVSSAVMAFFIFLRHP